MTILSITTADYNSFETGTLKNFLSSCETANVEVFLILRDYQSIPHLDFPIIVHRLFVSKMSLSDARNSALRYIFDSNFDISSYSFIAFLDDDCEVTPSLAMLENTTFESDILIGSYGPSLKMLSSRFLLTDKNYSNMNAIIDRVASCTLYFKPHVVRTIGYFYPKLGVPNQPFCRGEDTEYFLRAVDKGFTFSVVPAIFVKHPYKPYKREESILSDLLLSFRYFSKFGSIRFVKLIIKSIFYIGVRKVGIQHFFKILPESKALRDFALLKR